MAGSNESCGNWVAVDTECWQERRFGGEREKGGGGGGGCLFVGCLTTQQHGSVSQGRIC